METAPPAASVLLSLQPTRKELVIDLVRAAGLDVSDWSNSARGEPGASTNPKYCYEWVFVEPGNAIVLNLWHEVLHEESNGQIAHRGNFREDASHQIANGRANPWGRRATRMDEALKLASRDGLAVRVILNAGKRRDRNDPEATSSTVNLRKLDPEPWTIAHYDAGTGAHLLVRGLLEVQFVDQFEMDPVIGGPARRRDVLGSVYARDGRVRLAALRRANGRCEYCAKPGFMCPNGSVYLETHHIIPLHEHGPDTIDNVIALCPTDHREAHFGRQAAKLRDGFQRVMAQKREINRGEMLPLSRRERA